jgi:hypothetical protein
MSAPRPRDAGQAAVELVALLPLLLLAGLAGAAILASQSAGEQAGQAAQAGAMALLQGGDPRTAARQSLPDGVRSRSVITVDGRRVTVRVRPRVPLAALAGPLTAEASASAGPLTAEASATGGSHTAEASATAGSRP